MLVGVGDADHSLVVLSGRTEIVDRSDGGEFVFKSSGPGLFDGELGLLTAQPRFTACVVGEDLGVGPETGRMRSASIVEVGQPLATLTG